MGKSKVYFTDLRTKPGMGLTNKMIRLVNAAPVLTSANRLSDLLLSAGGEQEKEHHCSHGENLDKFHLIHPDTCWQAGVEHGEKIGLGNCEYELIKI